MAKSKLTEGVFYVYVFFRLDGSPCYVGKGHGDRWYDHESRPVHANKAFNALLRNAERNGAKLPKAMIAEGLSEAAAFEIERALIQVLGRKSLGTGCLVNLTDGGEGESGRTISAEARQKMRLAKLGRKLTDEHKRKIGQKSLGRKHTPESKLKLSAALNGKRKGIPLTPKQLEARRSGNNPGHTGHRHTDAAKAKMRSARKQKLHVKGQLNLSL